MTQDPGYDPAGRGPQQYGTEPHGAPGYDPNGYRQQGAYQPGYHPGYGQPGYPQPGYPQPGYPQPGDGQPGYPGAYPIGRPTNTMAIMALIFAFVFSPLGIVFGVIARRQIAQSGEGGSGLATAGLVLGIVFTAISLLAVIAAFALLGSVATSIPSSY